MDVEVTVRIDDQKYTETVERAKDLRDAQNKAREKARKRHKLREQLTDDTED